MPRPTLPEELDQIPMSLFDSIGTFATANRLQLERIRCTCHSGQRSVSAALFECFGIHQSLTKTGEACELWSLTHCASGFAVARRLISADRALELATRVINLTGWSKAFSEIDVHLCIPGNELELVRAAVTMTGEFE